MSESSTIIDPYRSSPAQGDIISAIQEMMLRREQLGQLRRADIDRGATNMAINEQQGWQGVDPQQMQQFNRGELDMRNINQQMGINQAVEGRNAQTYQQNQDFAQQYNAKNQQMLQNSPDPGLQSIAGMPANPGAVSWILEQLGAIGGDTRKFNNQQTLQQSHQDWSAGQASAERQAAESRMLSGFNNERSVAEYNNQAADLRQQNLLNAQAQQQEADRKQITELRTLGAKTYQDMLAGKASLGEVIANNPQVAPYIIEAAQMDAATKKALAEQEWLNKNKGGSGSKISIGEASAQSRQDSDAQRQALKDDVYNRRKGYWNHLKPGQLEQIYNVDANGNVGSPHAKGLELLEKIRQAIVAPGNGPSEIYYRERVPDIVKMVKENLSAEDLKTISNRELKRGFSFGKQ